MLKVTVDKKLKQFQLRASFEAGDELLALFGPSGAGKSLTLQCIAGLVKPDAGTIMVDDCVFFDAGKRINLPPQKRRVGYVFQNYALLPHLSVEGNIAYGLNQRSRDERAEKVRAMIRMMRLEGLEKRRPGELSGGQQQRVAIGRALAIDPSILLLDEPFSALDSAIRSKLRTEMLQLLQPLGITTVLVTHNLEEAFILSHKMAVLDSGTVLQTGTREDVLYRPKTRTVAKFTGAKNIFPGIVTAVGEDYLEIDSHGLRVVAPLYPRGVGDVVEFCIRPEHIMLLRAERESEKAVKENQLTGTIVQEIGRGGSYLLLFKADELPNDADYHLHIEVPAHVFQKLNLALNKRWTISLKKAAIHVMDADHSKQHPRARASGFAKQPNIEEVAYRR